MRVLEFDDLYRLPNLSDPQLSPDGRQVLAAKGWAVPFVNPRGSDAWVGLRSGTDRAARDGDQK